MWVTVMKGANPLPTVSLTKRTVDAAAPVVDDVARHRARSTSTRAGRFRPSGDAQRQQVVRGAIPRRPWPRRADATADHRQLRRMDADQARSEAKRLLADAAQGTDPAAERATAVAEEGGSSHDGGGDRGVAAARSGRQSQPGRGRAHHAARGHPDTWPAPDRGDPQAGPDRLGRDHLRPGYADDRQPRVSAHQAAVPLGCRPRPDRGRPCGARREADPGAPPRPRAR